MKLLQNRRILLIGIGFYDYEKAIADEFRRLGAEVIADFESAPRARDRFAPFRNRIFPVTDAHHALHHDAVIERSRQFGPLDDVVVINGMLLTDRFLDRLRSLHPNARFVSYLWDSLKRFPKLIERRQFFDRMLTFDPVDAAANPDLLFRPTFFRPELSEVQPAAPLDLCFVGWLHHNRLKQVEALRSQADDMGLSSFFYLFTGIRTGVAMWMRKKSRDVHVRTIPFDIYAKQIAASRVIIDLPHPLQTGLTMRAAEAVGIGKKLLTTATGVSAYDFYRPENVSIIDAQAPLLDPDFLSATYTSLPVKTADRYSLRAWALDILGLTEPKGFLSTETEGQKLP